MKLSPHFTLAEMTRTQVRGVPNMPPDAELNRLRMLCANVLEPIRARFGPVVIHSGYRSLAVNRRVGGSARSQHCKGEAADFHVIGADFFTVARWITGHVEWDQLILEFCDPSGFGGGWLHCSYTEERTNRKLITEAAQRGGKTVYTNIAAAQIPVAS